MSIRTGCKFLFVCSILLFAAAAMAQLPPTCAQPNTTNGLNLPAGWCVPPTTIFQVDGNAAASPSGPIAPATTGFPTYPFTCVYDNADSSPGPLDTSNCDYWNALNGTGSPVTNGLGAGSVADHSLTRVYIDGTAQTQVLSSGSKDIADTSTWSWAGHKSPNKDTFLAGYAAAYEKTDASNNTDLLLVFGANRVSPSGDANVGIWFFQQDVEPQSGGTFGPGKHQNGDVFIVSAFTGGGGNAGVTIYAWAGSAGKTGGSAYACAGVTSPTGTTTPGACAATNLEFVGSASASSVCDGFPSCAITNPTTTGTSWNSNVLTPLFFTGGLDLTGTFRGANLTPPACLSSFQEETRSSQSPSAELKDFLGSKFSLCGASISKQCTGATLAADGTTTYGFSGKVHNSGIGPLFNIVVTDTYPTGATPLSPDYTTGVAIALPDNCNGGTANCLQSGNDASFTGSFTLASQNNTAVNEVSATAGSTSGGSDINIAVASWPLQGATDPNPGDIAGPAGNIGACIPTPTAALAVSKSCTVAVTSPGGVLTIVVNFSGTVHNPANSECTAVGAPYTCCTGSTTGTCSDVEVTGITLCDAEGTVNCPSTAGSGQITSTTYPAGETAGTLKPGETAIYAGSYTPTSFSCSAALGVCSFTDAVFAAGTGADNFGAVTASGGATCHLCPLGACSAGN